MKLLLVDRSGIPQGWISPKKAIKFYVKNEIIWELGETVAKFESANLKVSDRIVVEPKAIIGIKGSAQGLLKSGHLMTGKVGRKMLFARDRWCCAYCGEKFPESTLTKEHIIPQSRGGDSGWMNLVTACLSCNTRKSNKTPEEARMSLLYVPYVPSKWEGMILENRMILGDQMDFLMARVPKNSRLWL